MCIRDSRRHRTRQDSFVLSVSAVWNRHYTGCELTVGSEVGSPSYFDSSICFSGVCPLGVVQPLARYCKIQVGIKTHQLRRFWRQNVKNSSFLPRFHLTSGGNTSFPRFAPSLPNPYSFVTTRTLILLVSFSLKRVLNVFCFTNIFIYLFALFEDYFCEIIKRK